MTDKMLNVKVISFNDNMLVSINRGMTVYCKIAMHFFYHIFYPGDLFMFCKTEKKYGGATEDSRKLYNRKGSLLSRNDLKY